MLRVQRPGPAMSLSTSPFSSVQAQRLPPATEQAHKKASLPSRRRSLGVLLARSLGKTEQDVESQQLITEHSAGQPTAFEFSLSGPATLLGVAFLWGTYGPALRLLYSLPGPPDPAALTAARGVIQAGSLWISSLLLQRQPPVGSGSQMKSKEPRSGASVWRAGGEMGFWNFLATSLQAVGLEQTSAVRSAFIIQATSILTPLLATLTGEWPSRNVWTGCVIALGSTLLITLDTVDPGQVSGISGIISFGDAAVFGASFFYSVTTVRLTHYAQQLPAISVASAKSTALAAWAVLWLSYLAFQKAGAGEPIVELWEGVAQPEAWLLVLWSALGPGALAAFLQTKGQSSVPSSQAQVYYSSTPIWSALLAMLILKGEAMGPLGWLGGAGIVIAGLLASR